MTRTAVLQAMLMLGLFLGAGSVSIAEEFIARAITVPETKAVFAQVRSRTIVPARARIGGTIQDVRVQEGDGVKTGQIVAVVVDEKIALELEAAEAGLKALQSQLVNARTELERVEQLVNRGSATQSRLDQVKTQFDVVTSQIVGAQAEMAAIEQRASEGDVLAPDNGRVLTVPVTKGSVILPGEEVARIASGQYFLRLAIPERHSAQLREGASVAVGSRGMNPMAEDDSEDRVGKIVKIYPEIKQGRVTADVEVEGLGDYFVNERTLVRVPVGERSVVAVPANAIATRHGVDYVRLVTRDGEQDVAVILGRKIDKAEPGLVEVLSGLRDGDRVLLP
ncbi:efflux RND transporter periplasmic adaptor subunit [Roseibium salinum]|uniref:Efflux RND transporter periplasmic adaptor subunit n=1 Tax=Roseibium salinum TaxID=1604349 RepID=A0ABT3QW29_9HYPH|nr:efflux RND transporter periplasmic adaptor subunit [Roseibium sp. DSM 29163]MCX2721131.1 efflux RND transporter periplasmic adaptor subunit [Roseibium sp. DSM 29163]